MWRVEYTKEALNYIADNGALIAPLYFALRMLVYRGIEGISTGELVQRPSGLYVWTLFDHVVYLHEPRDEDHVLVVALILPPP